MAKTVKNNSRVTAPADLDKLLMDELKDMGVSFNGNTDYPSRLSTGSPMFDYILGNGGLPRGRITMLYGEESSGKTTLSLICAAHVIKNAATMFNGGRVAIIDTEHTITSDGAVWAARLGAPVYHAERQPDGRVFVFHVEKGETALELLIRLVKSKQFDLVIFDSIADVAFSAELEGDMETNQVGLAGRKYGLLMRKLTHSLYLSGTAVVMINQIRMKIGILFGSPETEPGGLALKFGASIRIRMDKPNRTDPTLLTLRPRNVKNKTAEPYREGEVSLIIAVRDLAAMADELDPEKPVTKKAAAKVKLVKKPRVDVVADMVKLGNMLDVFVDKNGLPMRGNGTWFFSGVTEDCALGVGEKNVRKALYRSPDLRARVGKAIDEAIFRRENFDDLLLPAAPLTADEEAELALLVPTLAEPVDESYADLDELDLAIIQDN